MPKLSGATNRGRQADAARARDAEARSAPLDIQHCPAEQRSLLETELAALLSGEIGDPDAVEEDG